MDRKTNIHQFTFVCSSTQAKILQDFAVSKGETMYDCKFSIRENTEGSQYQKCHLKFFNCGTNLASRKLAEFLLTALESKVTETI